jgi:P4 family phage/plasmid primase-like protien
VTWVNYFVTSLHAEGVEGHLPADQIAEVLRKHKGGEAYHCAFDLLDEELRLEEILDEVDDNGKKKRRYHAQTVEALKRFPKTVAKYVGVMRPAFGYVWFDFDSHDGGVQALVDAKHFAAWLNCAGLIYCYSGSKGFHIGVPFSYFGLEASPTLGKTLNQLATALKKKTYSSLDTTVFNANRKFRALGTKHPKTGLYKILLPDLSANLDEIQKLARKRGVLSFAEAPKDVAPLPQLAALTQAAPTGNAADSISLDEWRRYRQPDGARALSECAFLAWAKAEPGKVNEPQWYAAASIVGRFKDGKAQFQALSKGHPGYSAERTDEKLTQALQASGPRTCKAINEVWGECSTCQHFEKIKSPVVILDKEVIATEATGFYDLIRSESNEEIKRVPNYNDLLSAFRRDRAYKTIADMRSVFVFTGTHYAPYTPIEIKGFAEERFEPKPKETQRHEFLQKVFANEIALKNFFHDGIENKINFKNGVLDLATRELSPHSPLLGFRWVLPYDFDPHASCSAFDAWIKDVMLGDAELIAILQEFMGYILSGSEYKYHKALWLYGTGRNGKSTFLSVLKSLVGAGNYSNLSIKQIISDKFASSDLDGKIVNFSEETSPEELSDSGPFKNLTGDGDLMAQRKYGDPYSFRNRAKIVMTYNEVPMLRDLSPGMLSRPIIIPWKKDLTADTVQDKNLLQKLRAELPGIFNFALLGWDRLEKQSEFTQSAKSKLELDEVRDASCSASQWLKENVEFLKIDNTRTTPPRTLYDAYKASVGQYAYAENKFYKRINAHPEVAKRKRRTNTGMEYFALRLRSNSSAVLDF